MLKREKVTIELNKVRNQIEKLKQKEKQLQLQKKELDDIEIVKTANKIGITPEQLYYLENLTEKEIKKLLEERKNEVEGEEILSDESKV